MKKIYCGACIILLCLNPAASSSEAEPPAAKPVHKKILRYPYVQADRGKQEVRVQAETSDEASILEFIVIAGYHRKVDVAPAKKPDTEENPDAKKPVKQKDVWNFDRAYESVFLTRADPTHIQMGLFFIGLKPGAMPAPPPDGMSKSNAKLGGDAAPDKEKKAALKKRTAPMLDVFVEWKEKAGGKIKIKRIEDFLFDRSKKKKPPPTPWAFNGSYLFTDKKSGKLVLFANVTKVIGAVFFDSSALFNLPYYAGNAHWDDNATGFEIKAESLPPWFVGTFQRRDGNDRWTVKGIRRRPVTLIIRPSKLKPPAPVAKKKDAPPTTATEPTKEKVKAVDGK